MFLRFRQGIDTGDGVKAVKITDGHLQGRTLLCAGAEISVKNAV